MDAAQLSFVSIFFPVATCGIAMKTPPVAQKASANKVNYDSFSYEILIHRYYIVKRSFSREKQCKNLGHH